jgi:sugar fermentation stimulation protein A
VRFEPPLVTGSLVRRYKRFLADVELSDGTRVIAHVPNTGSMRGTSDPGSPVALSAHPEPGRRLPWTLELVRAGDAWVGVNTARTNRLAEEAIRAGSIAPLRGYPALRREVRLGGSRLDFLLEGPGGRCFVEVKNVTYRVGRRALFPDAVTERGARHLSELEGAVRAGHRGVLLLLVNRGDCVSFGPAREIDPAWGAALDRALDRGVEVLAYRVLSSLAKQVVDRKLPVVR